MQSEPSPVPPGPGEDGQRPGPAPAPPIEPQVTVAAAARRLGIAPATLRTWDRRYGIGPSDHTPGRHRRYTADDLARLELMQHALVRGANPAEAARHALAARLPRPDVTVPDRPQGVAPEGADAGRREADERGAGQQPARRGGAGRRTGTDGEVGDPLLADTEGPGEIASRVRVGGRVLRLPGAGRRARGLGRAALSLDSATAGTLLEDAIAADGVETAWEEVALPVLVAVGARWAATGAGAEIEHMLSQCVTGVFSAHAARAPARAGRAVVLAGMPGEQHILPLVVLSAALADRGVPSRQLGPDLPVEALVAALRRTAPAAIVLWSQLPSTADGDVVAALPRTRPRARLFVGGPGWAEVTLPATVGRLTALASAVDIVTAAVT